MIENIEGGRPSPVGEPSRGHRVVDRVVFVLKAAAVIFVATEVALGAKTRIRSYQPPHISDEPHSEPFQRGDDGSAGRHAEVNDKARRLTHKDRQPRGRRWKWGEKREEKLK